MGTQKRVPLDDINLQNALVICEAQVDAWAAQRLETATSQHTQDHGGSCTGCVALHFFLFIC
jgi:hypothetical protein